MERYDSIEYGFEDNPPKASSDVQVTQKDGFITSQHYTAQPQSEAASIDADEQSEEQPKKERSKKDRNTQRELVVVCQLAVCIIIAAAAYIIKSFGGDIYERVRELYYDNLNNSLIIDLEKDSNDQAVRTIINDILSEQN